MFAAEAGRFRKRRLSGQIRERKRKLESRFGRVVVRRHGVRQADEPTSRFPLDERLGLPKEIYSLGLRRLIAEETRVHRGSRRLREWTRPLEATCRSARPKSWWRGPLRTSTVTTRSDLWSETANDTATSDTLLVMSCDGKGVAMRPEALRKGDAAAAAAVLAAVKKETDPNMGMVMGNALGRFDLAKTGHADAVEKLLREKSANGLVLIGVINTVMTQNGDRFRPVLEDLADDPDLGDAVKMHLE